MILLIFFSFFLFRLTAARQTPRRSSVKGAKSDDATGQTARWAPISAVLPSCEQPKTAWPCRSWPLLPGPAIFRAFVDGERAYPTVATICSSPDAPVAESVPVACFPTDAVRL